MSMKEQIISVLLRVYPSSWRAEYGSELSELLRGRPLSFRVVGDVLWNGARQRARTADVSTVVGLVMMLVILGRVMIFGWTSLLQDSGITFPRVVVKPFRSEHYVWLLILVGCITHIRHGGNVAQSGKAAVKVTFLAGLPIMAAGILISPASFHSWLAPLFALPLCWIWGLVGGGVGRWTSPHIQRRIASR
jgi:hypothetical protein